MLFTDNALVWPFTDMAQWVVGITLSDMIHIIVLSCTSHFLSHSFSLTKLRWPCASAVYICVCGGAHVYMPVHWRTLHVCEAWHPSQVLWNLKRLGSFCCKTDEFLVTVKGMSCLQAPGGWLAQLLFSLIKLVGIVDVCLVLADK